jgi:hypothetical protein
MSIRGGREMRYPGERLAKGDGGLIEGGRRKAVKAEAKSLTAQFQGQSNKYFKYVEIYENLTTIIYNT